ncbi:MAG: hypothetical protein R3C14_17960 [Caldilineaceae bacterium]
MEIDEQAFQLTDTQRRNIGEVKIDSKALAFKSATWSTSAKSPSSSASALVESS